MMDWGQIFGHLIGGVSLAVYCKRWIEAVQDKQDFRTMIRLDLEGLAFTADMVERCSDMLEQIKLAHRRDGNTTAWVQAGIARYTLNEEAEKLGIIR